MFAARRSTSLLSAARGVSSKRLASSKSITQTLEEIIPERQEFVKKLKSEHGSKSLGEIKVENLLGGMRGLKVMLWEPSVLDANEGIRFWGKTIPECQEILPSAGKAIQGLEGEEMLPEAMFWYLLTGQVPTVEQTAEFTKELVERSKLPSYVEKVIDSFPKTLHPMTQFVSALATLNHDSKFVAAYNGGVKKGEYWKPTLEDSLDCVAKSFTIASRIYRNKYLDGAAGMPGIDGSKDLSWNFSNQIGFGDKQGFIEVIRLYNALHTDHEGGNVSAHTTHLVGSALSDPFLSYSAALAGLAGPLHGLANQEALRFILSIKDSIGAADITNDRVKEELWKVLKSGRVVPGYGHAVLRKPDPRFIALRDFSLKYTEIKEDPVFKLVNKTFEVAPGVLTEHGKTKNPFPNVDAVSGSLLYHFGLRQFEYYTVTFGTSRAMGALSQLVWDRALGMPIERPKSLSMEAIAKIVGA
ncbi:citrate synthase-like protein [Atractiella rhizophila]|nr:citrate synthase-like protein [Atractiella rhizophila]